MCMYIYIYICTYIHIHICRYTYVFMPRYSPWTASRPRPPRSRMPAEHACHMSYVLYIICVYIYIYTYAYTHVYYICVYIYIYVYTYLFICMFIFIYTHMLSTLAMSHVPEILYRRASQLFSGLRLWIPRSSGFLARKKHKLSSMLKC